jgi:hypothetical protein
MRTNDSSAFVGGLLMESINEALIACVRACGGSKVVGPKLWPEKPVDGAQRLLLDCLNEDRPQKLAPEQVLLVMRMARDRGCHSGMQFFAEALSYADPVPVEPKDEAAELRREYIEAAKRMVKIAERIEHLERPGPRAVA